MFDVIVINKLMYLLDCIVVAAALQDVETFEWIVCFCSIGNAWHGNLVSDLAEKQTQFRGESVIVLQLVTEATIVVVVVVVQ